MVKQIHCVYILILKKMFHNFNHSCYFDWFHFSRSISTSLAWIRFSWAITCGSHIIWHLSSCITRMHPWCSAIVPFRHFKISRWNFLDIDFLHWLRILFLKRHQLYIRRVFSHLNLSLFINEFSTSVEELALIQNYLTFGILNINFR